jgi:hypothetical protein
MTKTGKPPLTHSGVPCSYPHLPVVQVHEVEVGVLLADFLEPLGGSAEEGGGLDTVRHLGAFASSRLLSLAHGHGSTGLNGRRVVAAAASAYLVQGTGEWTDGVGQPCGPDTTPTQRWSDVQSRTSMRGAT